MARKAPPPAKAADNGEDDKEKKADSKVRHWLAEIDAYDKKFKNWDKRSRAIVKRYRDEQPIDSAGKSANKSTFNILWSNIQTLQPAIYSRTPLPDVSRRYKDRDPVGLAASEILERCLFTTLDQYDFDGHVKGARDDYLLTARGQLWVRYVPYYGAEKTDRVPLQARTDENGVVSYIGEDGDEIDADEIDVETDDEGPHYKETYRPVEYEEVVCDHIAWDDFGHTVAPTWAKVTAVWKCEDLTRKQLIERFGKEIASKVSLSKTINGLTDDEAKKFGDTYKRAQVYEIWDKNSRKAIWISPGYKEAPLDEQDDPLGLKGFFPCPKPMFGTVTGETLVPVPDFAQYQSQANEIDVLTKRINALIKALKLSGAYDQTAGDALGSILEGGDNNLVPVAGWAAFAEKGGLKGSISFLPIAEVASVVTALTQIRERMKADLYEISGISDIVRGQGVASETATAQRIKGQFATLRLEDRQKEMARFVRDAIRISAEIIAEHFSPETMLEMSGWLSTPMAEELNRKHQEAMAAAQQAMAQAQGVAPQAGGIPSGAGAAPPPAPPALPAQLPPSASDVFQQAVQLLRDDKLRSFRIDIETDSTISEELQGGKQAVTEFMTMLSGYLKEAVPAGQMFPALARPLTEALFFSMRRFKAGRQLEQVFSDAMDQMAQMPGQAQQKDSEAKAQQQRDAMQMQQKAASDQRTHELDMRKQAFEEKRHGDEMALEDRKMNQELMIARQSGKVPIVDENVFVALGNAVGQLLESQQQTTALLQQSVAGQQQLTAALAQGLESIRQTASAPKSVEVVRDPVTKRVVGATATPVVN